MTRPLVHRFTDLWRTDLGHKIRVELQDAPDVSQEANFIPRRIAVVQKTPLVSAGTVISGEGTAYLLVDQVTLAGLQRYRAFEITHHLSWTRMATVTDSITGFARSTTPTSMSPTLPCVVEPIRTIEDQGLERVKMKILVGSDARVGDKIGPYEVFVVIPFLGVKLLEVY